MKVFEKFDQKSGINQDTGIGSSIEESLLYNMHQFVFPPTIILKAANVNNTLYYHYLVNFDAYSRPI